jgi:hypothetical protein
MNGTTTTSLTAALLWTVLGGCGGSSASIDDFLGDFEGSKLSVTLRATEAGAEGVIRMGGAEYAATGKLGGDQLDGTFESNGDVFDFTLLRREEQLLLTTGGTEYELRRKVKVNPLALVEPAAPVNPLAADPGSIPSNPPNPLANPVGTYSSTLTSSSSSVPAASDDAPAPSTAAAALTQEHADPNGGTFRYPAGWQVQPTDGALQLVPPDLRTSAQGPQEILLLAFLPAEAGSVRDPVVPQEADGLIAQLAPFLRREGQPVIAVVEGRDQLRMQWQGKSPLGIDAVGVLWCAIEQGTAITQLAILPADARGGREPTLQAIFASARKAAPRIDPQLVGPWSKTDTYLSGEFSSVSVQYLTFFADGRCTRGSGPLYASLESHDSAGELDATTTASVEGGGEQAVFGQWQVGEGGTLTIRWPSGSVEEYTYYVGGQASLMLKYGTDGKELWNRR